MILRRPYTDESGKPIELIVIDEDWMRKEYDMLASEIFQPVITKFGLQLPPSSFVTFKCNRREHERNWGRCSWWGVFRKMTIGDAETGGYIDRNENPNYPTLERQYRGGARDKIPLKIRKMEIELRTSHYMLESVYEDVLVHEMVHAVVQWNHLWAGAEGGHQGWFRKLSDMLNSEYSEMFHIQRYVHQDDNSEIRLNRKAVEREEARERTANRPPRIAAGDIYIVDVKFDGLCHFGRRSHTERAGFVFKDLRSAQFFVNKIWEQQGDDDDASYAHVIPDAMESAYGKDDGEFIVYVDDMTIYQFVPSESESINNSFISLVSKLPKPSVTVGSDCIDQYDLNIKRSSLSAFRCFWDFMEFMKNQADARAVCIKKVGDEAGIGEEYEPDSFKSLSSISESMFGQAGSGIMQKVRRLASIIKRSLFSDNGGQRIIRKYPDGSYEVEGWIS